MKTKFLTVVLAAVAGFTSVAPQANAATGDSITFSLKVSAGAAACLALNAGGRVTISDLGPVQNMHVELFNMPAKTEFATFLIQVPKSPFGLSWYQGDIVLTPMAGASETSQVSSAKRRLSKLLTSHPRQLCFLITRASIRLLVQSRSITWGSGSLMQPKPATLTARPRLRTSMATTRPAFKF